VRLLWSDDVRVPVATGFLRPAILLPSHLALHLDEAEIEDIVIHELAHLARRDDWTQLFDRLLGALVWFHPLARWVLARIRAERELCCDDWVIRTGASARGYAASLVKLAEFRRRDPALALAVTSGKNEMTRRIEALLRTRCPSGGGISSLRLMLAGLALASLLVFSIAIPGVLSAVPFPQDDLPPAAPLPPEPPSAQLPPKPPGPHVPSSRWLRPRPNGSRSRPWLRRLSCRMRQNYPLPRLFHRLPLCRTRWNCPTAIRFHPHNRCHRPLRRRYVCLFKSPRPGPNQRRRPNRPNRQFRHAQTVCWPP
jgi:hypothetical protein